MGKSAANRKASVSIKCVDHNTFSKMIAAAVEIAEVPLVKTEFFMGGESIGCVDELLYSYEITSIRAMEAYIAQNRNMREKDIETLIEAEFSVESIAHLRRDDFRNVIAFLADLRMEVGR